MYQKWTGYLTKFFDLSDDLILLGCKSTIKVRCAGSVLSIWTQEHKWPCKKIISSKWEYRRKWRNILPCTDHTKSMKSWMRQCFIRMTSRQIYMPKDISKHIYAHLFHHTHKNKHNFIHTYTHTHTNIGIMEYARTKLNLSNYK